MFGLKFEEELNAYVGYRAIYIARQIDLVPGRGSKEGTEPHAKALSDWLDKPRKYPEQEEMISPWLRMFKLVPRMLSMTSSETYEDREGRFILRASPNSSGGYLYIGAGLTTEMTSGNPEPVTAEEAESLGFPVFNGGAHFCIDIPDGNSTVTCRTSDGRKFTAAFVPYTKGGPPECVDIQHHHTTGRQVSNGEEDLPAQRVKLFGPGGKALSVTPEQGYTLTTVILQH